MLDIRPQVKAPTLRGTLRAPPGAETFRPSFTTSTTFVRGSGISPTPRERRRIDYTFRSRPSITSNLRAWASLRPHPPHRKCDPFGHLTSDYRSLDLNTFRVIVLRANRSSVKPSHPKWSHRARCRLSISIDINPPVVPPRVSTGTTSPLW